jgi:hypothetical protein
VNKLDEPTMPVSLDKNFYANTKTWKRFIEINIGYYNPTVGLMDTKKVKKGEIYYRYRLRDWG